MAEKLVDVIVKLRQRGKKYRQPKLLCDIKMVTFFLVENAKKRGRSDDTKQRNRGWPKNIPPTYQPRMRARGGGGGAL